MVALNFDATQYEPSTGAGSVFEDGIYDFQIVGSSYKQPRSGGDNWMLVLECSCLTPGFVGRKHTIYLNIRNSNEQAMEIAHRELSALAHCIGVLRMQQSEELHGRPFKISLAKRERTDKPGTYGNDTLGFMDYAGNPPTTAGGQSSPGSAPAAPQPPAPQPVAAAPVQAPAPVAAAAPAAAPAQTVAPAPAPAPQPAPFAPAPVAAPAAAPTAAAPWAASPAPAAPGGTTPPWLTAQ